MHTSLIANALSSVTLAPAIECHNVVMFPLVNGNAARSRVAQASRPPAYAVLDDALASGDVEITEVSDQGSVPELRVVNRGATPTLIVDGEELVGAKQNRVVNLTILVAAQSALTIPVSCVEAGRWRSRSRTFSSSPRTHYATGRAKRMSQVTEALMTSNLRHSDQSEVWADIADKSARLNASSPTGAMDAMFADHAPFIDRCVELLRPVDGQVGALFAVDGRIVGFDLFDREDTLRKVLPKLVRSVAVDALDSSSAPAELTSRTPELFLAAVADSPSHTAPAVGMGEDVRLTSPGLTGAALVVDGHAVHVCALAQ